MTTTVAPSLRMGSRQIPVVLPNRRDPRLHLSMVIMSIHLIGITALGFKVSVPQILSAIIASALIDAGMTLKREKKLVWPASGILTGSGVGLILRLVGMGSGDYWVWTGWYYFAGIAAFSILSKYWIRWRGEHLFNPSNFGLVVAFLVIGREVIEPLDFWWAPMGFWMALAYLIIVGGGLIITRRLKLFEMAAAFWIALAASLGVLAASGHCMSASWSLTPVCGQSFWWAIVTSPETLIFLFFMITDPKTVPTGRAARVLFAVVLGLLATLLIAPQTLEFGAKVALLGSLVLLAPARALFDRILPRTGVERSGLAQVVDRLTVPEAEPAHTFLRGALVGGSMIVLAALIVGFGAPARVPALATPPSGQPAVNVDVDPASLPEVTVDAPVEDLKANIGDEDVDDLALVLAENLAIEGQAMLEGDGSLLAGADAGARLEEMLSAVNDAIATGVRTVSDYDFDTLSLGVVRAADAQSAALAFTGTGTVTEIAHDALGNETGRSSSPFHKVFTLSQIAGDRWLIVEVEDV